MGRRVPHRVARGGGLGAVSADRGRPRLLCLPSLPLCLLPPRPALASKFTSSPNLPPRLASPPLPVHPRARLRLCVCLRACVFALPRACSVVPDQECAANPNTLLALTRHGGHVAFLQGMWPLGRAYMDDVVMEFLQVGWVGGGAVHRRSSQGAG